MRVIKSSNKDPSINIIDASKTFARNNIPLLGGAAIDASLESATEQSVLK